MCFEFFWVDTEMELLDPVSILFLIFEEPPHFSQQLHHFPFPLTVSTGSSFPPGCPTSCFLGFDSSRHTRQYLLVILTAIPSRFSISSCAYWLSDYLLWRSSIQVFMFWKQGPQSPGWIRTYYLGMVDLELGSSRLSLPNVRLVSAHSNSQLFLGPLLMFESDCLKFIAFTRLFSEY